VISTKFEIPKLIDRVAHVFLIIILLMAMVIRITYEESYIFILKQKYIPKNIGKNLNSTKSI